MDGALLWSETKLQASWEELQCSPRSATAWDQFETTSRSYKAFHSCLLPVLDLEACGLDLEACALRMATTSSESSVAPQSAQDSLRPTASSYKVPLIKPPVLWNWTWQGLSESPGWTKQSSSGQMRLRFGHGCWGRAQQQQRNKQTNKQKMASAYMLHRRKTPHGEIATVPPVLTRKPHNLVFPHMSLTCPESLSLCQSPG